MENKCVYEAWVAPKSYYTESGTQEVTYNDSDVEYRFESCPDYFGLVSTIQRIEEVQIVRIVRNKRDACGSRHWKVGSNPVLTTKIKIKNHGTFGEYSITTNYDYIFRLYLRRGKKEII